MENKFFVAATFLISISIHPFANAQNKYPPVDPGIVANFNLAACQGFTKTMDNTLPNAQQHIQAAEQILIQMGAMEKHYQTMNSLDMSLGGSGYFNQAISNILTRANQYSKIGAEQSTQVHYHINTARALVQGYIDLHATIETICSKLIKLESLSDSSLLSKALTSKDLERCEINLGKSSSCAYIVTVNGIGFPDNKGCHANKSDAIKTLRDALQDRQCF